MFTRGMCFHNKFSSLLVAVSSLLVICWLTVDRQLADRFFGELFFTITQISVRLRGNGVGSMMENNVIAVFVLFKCT